MRRMIKLEVENDNTNDICKDKKVLTWTEHQFAEKTDA